MLKTIVLLTPAYISGFWTLVLLISRPSRNQARFFLGYFMLASFFIYLGLIFFLTENYIAFVHFEPVYNLSLLITFPLFYFFIRLLTVDVVPAYNYLWHYLPAILFAAFTFLVHRYYQNIAHQNGGSYISDIISIEDFHKGPGLLFLVFILAKKILLAFQIVFYSVKGIRLFNYHHQRILNFYSNESGRDITWVRTIYISLILLSLVGLIYNYIGKSPLQHNPGYLLISSVLFSTFAFIIGFLGNGQDQVVKEINTDQIAEIYNPYTEKWQDKELKEKLENFFLEKKIHFNPELTIWDVSGALFTNRTYISNFINQHYGINFSRFVNQYRVNEAKALLQKADTRIYSLETIGEKCGFGSLNNFIRVFQSFEGTTPGIFRKTQRLRD